MRIADLKASQQGKGQGANPFYISLSDLMLLLCVFFIMILGMSKVDIGTFERMRTGFSGSSKGTLVELAETLRGIAKDQPGISVRLAEDGVRVDLESATFFDTGSAVLKTHSLDPLLPVLKRIRSTNYTVDVEGHSDDRGYYRRNGDEVDTNWSLSGKRASSVVQYLIDMGFDTQRLRIVGYASNKPSIKVEGLDGDALEAARAKNRRVSLLVK